MQQRILFLTTSNLATNPRLVKEIRTCLELGHRTTVISFFFQNWSKPLNDSLLKEFREEAQLVTLPGDKTKFTAWIFSSLASMISRMLLWLAPGNQYFLSFAMFKRSWLLWQTIRKFTGSFDLVIAHNPGAFVPAVQYGKRKNVQVGIDLEDYHPGESHDADINRNMATMMKKVLPDAEVITAASPLILEHSLALSLKNCHVNFVINNVFSIRQQPAFKEFEISPLRLVWFSQTVGLNRGVQDVIQAMCLLKEFTVQLTIIGNCSVESRSFLSDLLTEKRHALNFVNPLQENLLIEECSSHHIGLALEPGFSQNNSLALSNKVFTYLLAGNAIVVSETKAQKKFIEENKSIGKSYKIGDTQQLADLLRHYHNSSEELFMCRRNAYELARTTLNWENESLKFIKAYNLN